MADDNKTTYNPTTGTYGVGKFNVPGANLRTGDKAGAVARYARDEYVGGIKQGFSDIGRDLRQSFGTQRQSKPSSSGDTNISSPSSSKSVSGQTKLQTSALLSIDGKLEDILLSQRTIQQDVSRLVFLVEELKSVSRTRDYSSPEVLKDNTPTQSGGNDKSILDMLLDGLGGPDRRGPRNNKPSKISKFFSRGALFNPLTLGAGGLATLAYYTGQARKENPQGAEQFDRTLRTGGERSQVIQGPESEREQFKDQPLPERAQRLTDAQKKQWLALPAEEKRKFQNNPTEWLKSQQAQGGRSSVGESFVDTEVGFSTNSTTEARLAKKLKAAYDNNTITLDQYKKGIEYIQSNTEERGGFSRQKLKEDFDIVGYVSRGVTQVSRQPVTTSGVSTSTSGPSVTASRQPVTTSGVSTSTSGPSVTASRQPSAAPTTTRQLSPSDTTTSQTTASERGLREAERARQGDDVRLNVKSYDIDSKGLLIFKSPSIRFETDKLEFIFREKVEKNLAQTGTGANVSGDSARGSDATGVRGSGARGDVETGGGGAATPSTGRGDTAGGGGRTTPRTGAGTGASPSVTGTGKTIAKVVEFGPGFNVVQYADGSTVKRTGPRNWRNNNPGNIEFGNFSRSNGAISGDPRFAIFPTYEMGRTAKEKLLWEGSGYRGKTIAQAISRYAPPSENNTQNYISQVCSALGVPANTLMSELSSDERKIMLNAMEKVEGYRVGREQVLSQGQASQGADASKVEGSADTASGISQGSSAGASAGAGTSAGTGATGGGTGAGGSGAGADTPSGAIPTESATPSESAPGQAGAGAGAGKVGGGGGNVRQAQSGIRKLPISDKLNSVLQQAARAAGVDVTVTSGGQPAYPKGPRTGSTRHDLGNAADLDLYVGGRILSDRNPADIELKKKFVAAATAAGASGIGAGYMGPTKIHVGFGTPAKWGGAPWLSGITPGSGAGATTTPSGGAGGGTGSGGGGGTTPMGGRGIGGGMTPMGGRGMGMDPGAMIGGLLGGLLGGRKFGGIGGVVGGLLGSALTNMTSAQSGGSGGATRGSSTEEGLTSVSAPMPPRKPDFFKGEAITTMLPDSFKNIMTDATTLGSSPDQSSPLFTTLPEFPSMKPLTPENAPVQIPNTPQVDTSSRSVADYNNSLSFMAGPPEEFFSSSGFTSVTPDPNFYGPGGKSGFSAGRLA